MENIGYLLMRVSKELKYALSKELIIYELTTSQWAVLKQLEIEEDCNAPLSKRTAVEIAAKLDFDKPTISGIINRLYEKGMVRKDRHPNDNRATILYLTPKAKELIPILETVSNTVIDDTLTNFSNEEKELFLNLLNKMDRSFNRRENR